MTGSDRCRRRRWPSIVLVTVIGGCTTTPATPAKTPAPTTASVGSVTAGAATAYVSAVNDLCGQIKLAVQQFVPSGYSPDYPVVKFRVEAPRLRTIYRAFDRQVAAIPIPPAARQAAAAFTAYRLKSDQSKAELLAAATSQRAFAADLNRQDAYWATSAIMARRDASGFSDVCNYR